MKTNHKSDISQVWEKFHKNTIIAICSKGISTYSNLKLFCHVFFFLSLNLLAVLRAAENSLAQPLVRP